MKGFTLGFQIDLICACNLKCNFCTYNDNSDSWRNGERLSFEKLKDVFDKLYENPPDIPLERLQFVGSGEPLLYKQLPEAISYAKRVFSYVGITTNGVLLTKEISQKLIDAGTNEISISITGASPEVYARHQGSGKTFDEVVRQFDLVKQNIENLCILRNMKKRPLNVLISTILHEGSKEDFVKCLNMWRNMNGGVNMVLFRTMNGIKSTSVSADSYEEYISNDLVSSNGFTPSCTMFGKTMQISVNGDLYICCALNEQTRIGNIFETDITEILNSEKFKKMVNAFHCQYRDVPEYCKRCSMGRSCATF